MCQEHGDVLLNTSCLYKLSYIVWTYTRKSLICLCFYLTFFLCYKMERITTLVVWILLIYSPCYIFSLHFGFVMRLRWRAQFFPGYAALLIPRDKPIISETTLDCCSRCFLRLISTNTREIALSNSYPLLTLIQRSHKLAKNAHNVGRNGRFTWNYCKVLHFLLVRMTCCVSMRLFAFVNL